jgi:tetratricopeptide (TPR) repeat protein
MIEWFKNLTDANKIAVVAVAVPIIIALISGIIKIFSKKKDGTPTPEKGVKQSGSGHTAAIIDGSGHKTHIAGGDVKVGINGDAALNQLITISKEAGRSEGEVADLRRRNTELKEIIRELEEQLAQPQRTTDISPLPTEQAKELAGQIEDEAGPYARALKAIADGNHQQADDMLDETQQFLDTVQEAKDRAQIKIYIARMQNAVYAGRHRDALQWCDRLEPLAGDNPEVLSNLAQVYHENALYQKADPLMRRALEIHEASFGADHPNVAIRLNNLAQLLQATNRLSEAEPLMRRALEIDEASFGPDHPKVAIRLNNLAQLLQATNRLSEAEPLMRRALEIDEASFGPDHPNVAIRLNNLAQLLQATNRLSEAEPLMRRALEIFVQFTRETRHPHPHLEGAIANYAGLLMKMGLSQNEVDERMKRLAPEMFDDAAKKTDPTGTT